MTDKWFLGNMMFRHHSTATPKHLAGKGAINSRKKGSIITVIILHIKSLLLVLLWEPCSHSNSFYVLTKWGSRMIMPNTCILKTLATDEVWIHDGCVFFYAFFSLWRKQMKHWFHKLNWLHNYPLIQVERLCSICLYWHHDGKIRPHTSFIFLHNFPLLTSNWWANCTGIPDWKLLLPSKIVLVEQKCFHAHTYTQVEERKGT